MKQFAFHTEVMKSKVKKDEKKLKDFTQPKKSIKSKPALEEVNIKMIKGL